MRSIGAVLGVAVLFSAGAASAQNVNVRGTITAFDGKVLSVKARDGRDVRIDLPEAVNVSTTKPFSLADIKPGMVLGVTTIKRAEGATVAIDVRPIPPAANQGLTPYDLQPESTMTNAAFEGSVRTAAGEEMVLNYKAGTVKVLVPPGTPMSQSAPGSRADLKPGETVYAATRREGDRLTALRVQVSKDGVKPTQ